MKVREGRKTGRRIRVFALWAVCAVVAVGMLVLQSRSFGRLKYADSTKKASIVSLNADSAETDSSSADHLFLVTGVAGYIGSHMALALLDRGDHVVGVDNMSRGSDQAVQVLEEFPHFKFEKLDLGDEESVQSLFRTYSFNAVIHMAGVDFAAESVKEQELYRAKNTNNTQLLADTMLESGVSQLLYSSTCAVYGEPDVLPVTEDSNLAPTSPYGESKLDAETYIQKKSSRALHAHVFRFCNVVGSDPKGRLRENPLPSLNQYARLWTASMDVVFKRRSCVTLHDTALDTPDGSAIRDYIHVSDVVNAQLSVLELQQKKLKPLEVWKKLKPFEVWNIATNTPTSTYEFIEAARRVTGVFIPICFSNHQNQDSQPKLYLSGQRLREKTAWQPQYTNIDVMLQTAWETKQEKDNWKSQHYDICIVGGGLSAAVLAERHVKTLGHSVLVVEKRDHIGGNVYDYIDKETGIRVSKYGVHLFHTKYDRVWEYLQQFSSWTPWEHRCLAKVGDKHVPVPVNIDSVNTLFDLKISSEEEMKEWLAQEQVHLDGRNASDSEEVALSRVGQRLYDMIFKPYTIKQWNKEPKELGPSVLARIPVRTNHDDRYFTDPHQALPSDGYTRIFENMFNSPKITFRLNTDFFDVRDDMKCGHTYFTGPIDAFYAAKGLPKLEYRSLTFERQVYRDTEYFQPKAHVNYPAMEYNYTRAIEYKHILHQTSPHTVVFFERSSDVGEPYYPVPNKPNQDLYAKYQRMAEQEPNVTFVGRLANYKYFNMDETVLNALELFDAGFGKDLQRCTPGEFSSIKQWKSLFGDGTAKDMGLSQKAMILIPVGTKSAPIVDKLVQTMGTDYFHFLLVQYDDYDWSTMAWFHKVEWIRQPPDSGTNWAMAKRFLKPAKVKSYSHVCVWDDDLAPTEYFDGEVFLQWLQKLNLELVQPMIRLNHHGGPAYYEGTAFSDRSNQTQVHEVHRAEIMAPCYSRKLWSSCIWPNIVNGLSSGWGIDKYLHSASCAPPNVYSLRLPLDHMDANGLDKSSGFDEQDLYGQIAKIGKWGHREYNEPLRDFKVLVNEWCQLTMAKFDEENSAYNSTTPTHRFS